jgi:hypothetical protein
VYFEDVGSTLDIPLEELESFMESDEHSSTHAEDVRNFEVAETDGPAVVVTFERMLDGHWTPSRSRVTSFPPYCRFIEELDGEFAGSRFVVLHRPNGAKTRVDLFGDIQCKGKSPEQLRKYWQGTLDKAHNEDMAALRRFRDRKRDVPHAPAGVPD